MNTYSVKLVFTVKTGRLSMVPICDMLGVSVWSKGQQRCVGQSGCDLEVHMFRFVIMQRHKAIPLSTDLNGWLNKCGFSCI